MYLKRDLIVIYCEFVGEKGQNAINPICTNIHNKLWLLAFERLSILKDGKVKRKDFVKLHNQELR